MEKTKDFRKARYFRWKHNIWYKTEYEQRTEEQFLKSVERKTLDSFKVFEKSQEYKALLALLLESKLADDMQIVYNTVSESAKLGDDKAVRLFLALSKEITDNAKIAQSTFEIEEENDEDDDLIID